MKNQLSIIKYTIIIVLLIILAIPCRSQIQPTGCYSSVAGSKACGVTWIETDNGVENSCVCNCNVIPPMVCTPVGSSSGSSSSGSGSAVVLPFPVDPGGIDIDGDDHGKPFFTSGQSDALEEWGTEYKMFQDLYGNVNALQIPLTGDFNLDMFYFNQSAAFNPPAYINNVNGEIYATDANGNRINNEKGKTVNLDEVGESTNSGSTSSINIDNINVPKPSLVSNDGGILSDQVSSTYKITGELINLGIDLGKFVAVGLATPLILEGAIDGAATIAATAAITLVIDVGVGEVKGLVTCITTDDCKSPLETAEISAGDSFFGQLAGVGAGQAVKALANNGMTVKAGAGVINNMLNNGAYKSTNDVFNGAHDITLMINDAYNAGKEWVGGNHN
jgi:hypothetical protein